MALLFCDGFDHYVIGDIMKKWSGWVNNSSTDISPSWARPPGGMGFHLYDNSAYRGMYKNIPNTATVIVGVNMYLDGTGNIYPVIALYDGSPSSTLQVEVRHDGSNHLQVSRNGTVLATSTNAMAILTWYHVEFKVTIHNTTGAYEVRVNGTSTGWIPPATNQNTRGQTSNNWVGQVALESSSYGGIRYDDFYVLDTTGSVANDFIGPQKVLALQPSGPGSLAQWTGNYAANFANVNESVGDGDNTFVQSATAGQVDLHTLTDPPAGTISAIQHVLEARQDGGAQRVIRTKTKIGATTYNGASQNPPGSHVFMTEPVSVSPATSAAWTATEISAAEFGYELVS